MDVFWVNNGKQRDAGYEIEIYDYGPFHWSESVCHSKVKPQC